MCRWVWAGVGVQIGEGPCLSPSASVLWQVREWVRDESGVMLVLAGSYRRLYSLIYPPGLAGLQAPVEAEGYVLTDFVV